MSSKQLLRLVMVLGVALLLWGAVALANRRSDTESQLRSILPKIDTSTIDTIVFAAPADTAVLVRLRGKAGWQVNGHAAELQNVADLLRGLADSGQTPELVARSPSSHARLRVSDDSGRRVRVVSRGKTVADLVAGKQSVETGGIYLRKSGAPEVYVVSGPLANALGRSSDEWRNHSIAQVTPDSVAAVAISRGGKSYTLKRRGTSWSFASGAPADSAKVAGLLASYRDIKASGFGSKAQQDSLRGQPRRTARLVDRRGSSLLSLTFDSTKSGLWVRVSPALPGETADEAYRLEEWTADQLTPPDSSLRKH
jgi:Domain of unknown function (DUF4340)